MAVTPDDGWFGSLPGWIQLASSLGVFVVAAAAGAYGFVRNLKGKAPETGQQLVLEQASIADSRPLLTLLEEVKKMNAYHERLVLATEKLASMAEQEHEQDMFERRVKEEVERRSNTARRTRSTD